jgi:antitoxin component of RelBE/YafQ-DinJ toxin-antitoxin module
MPNQKLTERLIPVRLDKPLQDELQRISEELGLPKSVVVRASLKLIIEPPSQVAAIIEQWKQDTEAWYKKRKEINDGEGKTNTK